jgi:hypothetical protein
VDDSGTVLTLNPLDDYIYRPKEIKLPLYIFYEQYTTNPAPFKGDKATGKKRTFPKQAFRFQEDHPQYATHFLSHNKLARVPWIQGPQLSRDPATNPERFGKLAACLFLVW